MKKLWFSAISLIKIEPSIDHTIEDCYQTIQEQVGEELKTEHNKMIKAQTEFPYTSFPTDNWDIIKESEKDTTYERSVVPGTLICVD